MGISFAVNFDTVAVDQTHFVNSNCIRTVDADKLIGGQFIINVGQRLIAYPGLGSCFHPDIVFQAFRYKEYR